MKKRPVCANCLNDTSVRNISFDQNHTCNFCQAYDKIKPQLNDYERLEQLFVERIERVRGKYDYDTVVGISGGKDSMFLLHQLVYKYKLKVKAFTMNNGFFTDEARGNIDRLVKEFGVEHEYITYDPEMLKRFYHYSMKKWLVPCIACSYIGYASMINYASKVNAGLCIHGRSPEQMFRAYNKDVFADLVNAGLKSIDEVDINALYKKLLGGISEKLDKQLMEYASNMLFKDIDPNDFREFVAYFLYHPYNEKEIVDFLETNTSWKVKSGEYVHYDCMVHNAVRYIYQCAEGRPHVLPEVSALLRMGDISRDEAEQLMQNAWLDSVPEDELNFLCKYAGVSKKMILFKAKVYNKVILK